MEIRTRGLVSYRFQLHAHFAREPDLHQATTSTRPSPPQLTVTQNTTYIAMFAGLVLVLAALPATLALEVRGELASNYMLSEFCVSIHEPPCYASNELEVLGVGAGVTIHDMEASSTILGCFAILWCGCLLL